MYFSLMPFDDARHAMHFQRHGEAELDSVLFVFVGVAFGPPRFFVLLLHLGRLSREPEHFPEVGGVLDGRHDVRVVAHLALEKCANHEMRVQHEPHLEMVGDIAHGA